MERPGGISAQSQSGKAASERREGSEGAGRVWVVRNLEKEKEGRGLGSCCNGVEL